MTLQDLIKKWETQRDAFLKISEREGFENSIRDYSEGKCDAINMILEDLKKLKEKE